MQARSAENEHQATVVFVLGLLGMVACQILAPIAWVLGNQYVQRCELEGVAPSGLGEAGRILGMVGTLILALMLLFFVVWFLFAAVVMVAYVAFMFFFMLLMILAAAAA